MTTTFPHQKIGKYNPSWEKKLKETVPKAVQTYLPDKDFYYHNY